MKSKTPREICLELLMRLEGSDRHLDALLTDAFRRYPKLKPLDRAFLTELAYGTVRWRGRLDWILGRFSKVSPKKMELAILNTLRLGLYQILFLSKTPDSAAVDESVELAKGRAGKGGAGFVNAVLRSILREKANLPYPDFDQDQALYLSVLFSHPLWLVRRWIEEMGVEATMGVLEANNCVAGLTLRTNTLKISRERLIERLKEKGVKATPTPYSKEGVILDNTQPVSALPFLEEGLYVIQDEASQLVVPILSPQPGERVLDACAAPGGKTTHIAQRMEDRGEIWALDLNRRKLRLIEEACARLGIRSVRTVTGDASRPLPIPEALHFDRILVDAPCTGFGTLRRNPDLKWKRGEEEVRRLSILQSSILENLSRYLREGGILVYSTCTVFREENEEVVEGFLRAHPEFELDRLEGVVPEGCRTFVRDRYFKTFPSTAEMDGFFLARLMKIGSSRFA